MPYLLVAICEQICDRDHLGCTSNFELGIWRESTSNELHFVLYCTVLACSVAKMCLHKVWNAKKYDGPKHLLPVKTATFHILSCYE